MNQRYKEIKKQLGITDADVARMFGYKGAVNFRTSTRKDKVVSGFIQTVDLITSKNKETMLDKLYSEQTELAKLQKELDTKYRAAEMHSEEQQNLQEELEECEKQLASTENAIATYF